MTVYDQDITYMPNRETGNVTAFFTHIPGLMVQGTSYAECRRKLSSVLSKHINRIANDTDLG